MINILAGGAVAFIATFFVISATVRIAARGTPHGTQASTRERLASALLHSGGTLLLAGIVLAHLIQVAVSGDPVSPTGLEFVLLLIAVTTLGAAIDFLERRQLRTARTRRILKFGGLGVIGIGFAVAGLNFPNSHGLTPASGQLSFVTNFTFNPLTLGAVGFLGAVVWIALIVTGGAVTVSAIEGYDGLAAGLVSLALLGYVFVTAWQYNESCLNVTLAHANLHKCYPVRDPETLTGITVILLAALIAFIWWNTHPAQIQLGESGSLLLGSSIAALAVTTHTELLLIALIALFATFARIALPPRSLRTSARRWPLPLHPSPRGRLGIAGTSEVTIVVRFWIVAGLLTGAGIATFYGTWAAQ